MISFLWIYEHWNTCRILKYFIPVWSLYMPVTFMCNAFRGLWRYVQVCILTSSFPKKVQSYVDTQQRNISGIQNLSITEIIIVIPSTLEAIVVTQCLTSIFMLKFVFDLIFKFSYITTQSWYLFSFT